MYTGLIYFVLDMSTLDNPAPTPTDRQAKALENYDSLEGKSRGEFFDTSDPALKRMMEAQDAEQAYALEHDLETLHHYADLQTPKERFDAVRNIKNPAVLAELLETHDGHELDIVREQLASRKFAGRTKHDEEHAHDEAAELLHLADQQAWQRHERVMRDDIRQAETEARRSWSPEQVEAERQSRRAEFQAKAPDERVLPEDLDKAVLEHRRLREEARQAELDHQE